MNAKHTPTPEYDDMLPVSLMGNDLLDRHNDRIAVFEPMTEIEDRERLVRAVNSYKVLKKSVEALHRDHWANRPKRDHDNLCAICPAIAQAEARP